MKREEVLDMAKALVCGERAKQYAPPKKNFARIAAMWEPILKASVTPAQVALCMAVVKITRLIEDETHQDSWVDLAGYAGCGAEAAEKEPIKEGVQVSHWGIHGGKQ